MSVAVLPIAEAACAARDTSAIPRYLLREATIKHAYDNDVRINLAILKRKALETPVRC
jgi:hypothetical protein